mmetsp:Transcript_23997/g.30535  ORF Transcript_23997/g.30535 Transcript_23997/m.30535 type:complete len:256 (-) Transcript_23997:568-1335(-)
MANLLKSAEILAKAFRQVPPAKLNGWPEGCGPKTVEEGYQVQEALHHTLDMEQVGWRVIDNLWLQDKFNTKELVYGRLYKEKIDFQATAKPDLKKFNVPRVIPHYTFRMADDITERVDYYTIQSKIAGMQTSMEVSDTRFDAEEYQYTLPDFIADNAHSGHLYIGERGNWLETDMASVESLLYVNKKRIQTAYHSSKTNPLEALHKFLNSSFQEGRVIKKGEYVSVYLNFFPRPVYPDEEVVAYTAGMHECTMKF